MWQRYTRVRPAGRSGYARRPYPRGLMATPHRLPLCGPTCRGLQPHDAPLDSVGRSSMARDTSTSRDHRATDAPPRNARGGDRCGLCARHRGLSRHPPRRARRARLLLQPLDLTPSHDWRRERSSKRSADARADVSGQWNSSVLVGTASTRSSRRSGSRLTVETCASRSRHCLIAGAGAARVLPGRGDRQVDDPDLPAGPTSSTVDRDGPLAAIEGELQDRATVTRR